MGNDSRSAVIAAKVRPEVKKAVQAAAAGLDLTVSGYVADCLETAARADLQRLARPRNGQSHHTPALAELVRRHRPDLSGR